MTAAGRVTTATIANTTAIVRKVLSVMNRLANNTPAKVARVGISTSATMLTVSDHDLANLMITPPMSTTGNEPPSARRAIWVRSFGGTVTADGFTPPQVSAAPHRVHLMVFAELGPQPLDVHGHR